MSSLLLGKEDRKANFNRNINLLIYNETCNCQFSQTFLSTWPMPISIPDKLQLQAGEHNIRMWTGPETDQFCQGAGVGAGGVFKAAWRSLGRGGALLCLGCLDATSFLWVMWVLRRSSVSFVWNSLGTRTSHGTTWRDCGPGELAPGFSSQLYKWIACNKQITTLILESKLYFPDL